MMTKEGEFYDRYEDITNNDLKSHIRPSMFCPLPEVANQQNLQRWSVNCTTDILYSFTGYYFSSYPPLTINIKYKPSDI